MKKRVKKKTAKRRRAQKVTRTETSTVQVKRIKRNPASEQQLREAVTRFTGFRGNVPQRVDRVLLPAPPRVMLTVGELIGIMYRTERDGVVDQYLHRFKKSARPTLAVSSDGRTLYLLGGAYRVTDRGIEDAR